MEGGRLGEMNNGTQYREVRQYRTDHHLVRFYFITRTFSQYVESIISDFEKGIKPDLVVVNSCVWDISRWDCFLLQPVTELGCLACRLTPFLFYYISQVQPTVGRAIQGEPEKVLQEAEEYFA